MKWVSCQRLLDTNVLHDGFDFPYYNAYNNRRYGLFLLRRMDMLAYTYKEHGRFVLE